MKKSLSIATAAAVAGYRSKSSGTGCSTIDTSGTLDVFGDGSCKAFYKLDGNANDESGTYNGTGSNITYNTGKFGQAAIFNGTSSKITTTIPLSLTQTFSFWIKTSVNGSEDIWTGAQGITGCDSSGGGSGDFSIKLNSTNKMMLFIGFVPGVDNFIQGTKTVTDNVWHHVVVTIDKANSKINLYVDGILDGTFSGTLSVLNVYNIEFGRNTFSYFNGSIDQVRIFNRALTSAEINILYNEKKVQDSTICDPYWSKTSLLLSGDGTNGAQNSTFNYKSSTYSDVVSTYTSAELQSITYDSYGWGEYHGNGTSLRDTVGDSYLRLYHTTLTIRNPFDCWIEFTSIFGPQGQDYVKANLVINGTAVGSNLKYINGKYYAFLPSGTNLITHPDDAVFGNPAIKKLSSSNTYSLTPTGTVLQGSVGPYTGFSSVYFDGSSFLASPNGSANFGTGDFTVELWANFKNITSDQYLLDGVSGNLFAVEYWLGRWYFQMGEYAAHTDYTITANTWYHIAVVRNGTSIKMYINGSMIFDYILPSIKSFDVDLINIGRHGSSINYNFNGYISNLRISKEAVYTSNFTPSKTPVGLTANTALLANFDNAGIVDSTGKNTLQTVGNAQISTLNKKFGTGSMYFDGNGDYITMPSSSNFELGTGDFTVEMWVNFNSISECVLATLGRGFNGGDGTLCAWNIFYYNGQIYFYRYNGSQEIYYTYDVNFSTSTWYHLTFTRENSILRCFLNGVQLGNNVTSTTSYNKLNSDDFRIGYCYNGRGVKYFNGYIDDLRITKGVARYTSNFTVPDKALPAQGI